MGPTWGPAGSCRPQLGPIWTPWILISGEFKSRSPNNGTRMLVFRRLGAVQIESKGCTWHVNLTIKQMSTEPSHCTASKIWFHSGQCNLFQDQSPPTGEYVACARSSLIDLYLVYPFWKTNPRVGYLFFKRIAMTSNGVINLNRNSM